MNAGQKLIAQILIDKYTHSRKSHFESEIAALSGVNSQVNSAIQAHYKHLKVGIK